MPVYRLNSELVFPPPDHAEDDGLLAVGGDLRPERLLLGYSQGIFPWYNDGLPILWHSPDPRMVLLPEQLHVSRSLRKQMRKNEYEIRFDTAFSEVVMACAGPRNGQLGTWITDEMFDAYCRLHLMGFAHSAEAWNGDQLVAGLYGVSLGSVYFGESMFTRRTGASKIAFVTLVRKMQEWGITLVDCQVHTDLLEGFGAEQWPRARFLASLRTALDHKTHRGRWQCTLDV